MQKTKRAGAPGGCRPTTQSLGSWTPSERSQASSPRLSQLQSGRRKHHRLPFSLLFTLRYSTTAESLGLATRRFLVSGETLSEDISRLTGAAWRLCSRPLLYDAETGRVQIPLATEEEEDSLASGGPWSSGGGRMKRSFPSPLPPPPPPLPSPEGSAPSRSLRRTGAGGSTASKLPPSSARCPPRGSHPRPESGGWPGPTTPPSCCISG